jgi:hypothetical protein
MSKELRKAGDLLILSGTLDEDTPMLAADWVGATGKINIVKSNGVVTVDHATVTLDTSVTPKRFLYEGAPLALGTYHYEVEVTFAGRAYPVTFPNDRSTNQLDVVAALA